MTGSKIFTLTRKYQLYALFSFVFFLINLLELMLGSPGWVFPVHAISLIAFLSSFVIFGGGKKEGEDELSRKNRLQADAFVLSAFSVCILAALVLLPIFGNTAYLIPIEANVLMALFWFIYCFRSTAFLICERLCRD